MKLSFAVAHACAGAAVWMFIASPAAAQRCVEVSSDGGTTTRLCDDDTGRPGGVVTVRSAGVPFGTEPDWANTQRRPVAAVRVADVNADGYNDLIAACFQANSFPPYDDWRNMIYFGSADGLETEPSWISTDQVHSGDIAVADFNKDGYVDLFFANGGFGHSPSVIYWGGPNGPSTSPGWFSATPQTTWALAAVAIDFDHDGDIDIITSNQSGITGDNYRPMYLFRNVNGTLEATPSWQSSDAMIANGVAVGDLDGDGWEDIAIAKWVNFQAGVYKNNNGTPSSLPIWNSGLTSGARGAAIGDVNLDGLPDLVFGYDPTRLYINDGNGGFVHTWTANPPFNGVQELMLVDVNGDGDLDLIETHFSDGRTHIYLNNNGTLSTTPDWTYDSPRVSNAVYFGDLNNDGCPDLVIGYSGEPSIVVFYAECASTSPCQGDVDSSGTVDVNDLLTIISDWGCSGASCQGDVTGDDVVSVDDLLAVIAAWGACP